MIYGPLDKKMTEYKYDCRNRLISAGGVTYEYDAENTRISSSEENKTTEYITDVNSGNFSKVLVTYETIKKEDKEETTTTLYVHGNGLISQNSSKTGYITYHYDNLGSTTAVTDETGKILSTFDYGPYGELKSKNNYGIRFLYNGQLGVETDGNGLYYMRARYYNSQIKRFINQDVLTGSITSSPTLNRYSYVEGNPINLTDPFGLSPSCGKSDFGHGMLNLLGMIPGLGEGFDIANSIWYFKEGNLTEGVLSLLSGLPIVGSIAVGGVKLFKGGEKAFETAEKIHKACRLISNGATFTRAGSGFIKSGEEIYKNYIKNGKPLDGNFALQAGSMVLNGVTMFFSGKAFVKDFKSMKLVEKMKNAAKKAADSAKAGFKKFISDETGSIKNPFFKGNNYSINNKYWNKRIEFNGTKVYQRDDLIDKNAIDARGRSNIQRMEDGLAPIGTDGNPINLHHMLQTNESAIAELTQTFHQKNTKIIHINTNQVSSLIDRKAFAVWKRAYWKMRAKDF